MGILFRQLVVWLSHIANTTWFRVSIVVAYVILAFCVLKFSGLLDALFPIPPY